ncbi:DUF2062 domain-containing protein [Terrilactibacillus sp. S3-3]|nr:DUF2062 domain-containing protein [Terrilactibacillus sp. S3-3]
MRQKAKYNLLQKMQRHFRFNMIKLFRSPGGARKVSLGFAIGFGLEMLMIPTAYLAYILLIPIVKLARASLPASIIGNVIGKFTFLPVILLPFAKELGNVIYPKKSHHVHFHHDAIMEVLHGHFSILTDILHGGIHLLIGMSCPSSVRFLVSLPTMSFTIFTVSKCSAGP